MEKLDLHYKLTKLKWKIRELKNKLSFRMFLFRIRVKNFIKRDIMKEMLEDIESLYPRIIVPNENNLFKIPEGFKSEDLTKFYGRFVK